MAGDAVSVAPNLYKVLLENDKVRVLETRYGPGVKSEMHSHPDLVAVGLTPILTLAVNAFLVGQLSSRLAGVPREGVVMLTPSSLDSLGDFALCWS